MAFEEFAKVARFSRGCVITEKIDGTNAQVQIVPKVDFVDSDECYVLARNEAGDAMLAGSRTRYIVPEADNFGFAGWVETHAKELWTLGPGRHYGEWWGSGIQRGYGLSKGEKRFSLINTRRWGPARDRDKFPEGEPSCCHVVPVLYKGLFSSAGIDDAIAELRSTGSQAAPGFMNPEGVIIYHEAAGVFFKKTLDRDEEPKGARR